MLRQAMMTRRVLLLLDGLDEGGRARDEIEAHVTNVLAPQGFVMLLTSRPKSTVSRAAFSPLLPTIATPRFSFSLARVLYISCPGVKLEAFEEVHGRRWERIGLQKPHGATILFKLGMRWEGSLASSQIQEGVELNAEYNRHLVAALRKRIGSGTGRVSGDTYSVEFSPQEVKDFWPREGLNSENFINVKTKSGMMCFRPSTSEGCVFDSDAYDQLLKKLRAGYIEIPYNGIVEPLLRRTMKDVAVEVDGLYFAPSNVQQRFLSLRLRELDNHQQRKVVKCRLKLAKMEGTADKLISFIEQTTLKDEAGKAVTITKVSRVASVALPILCSCLLVVACAPTPVIRATRSCSR